MSIGAYLGKLLFKLNGWKYEVDPESISDPKQVMVGFPHTTNMDGVRTIALLFIQQLPFHLLVKKEWFKFPIAGLLKRLGCIPVDRARSDNVVQQMVDEFAKHSKFSLAIAPEATRGKNGEKRPIKTGFWHIAKAANVPIVLMLSDSNQKMGRFFAKIYPSDSIQADLLEMKRRYAEYGVTILLPDNLKI